MTIGKTLQEITEKLKANDVPTARLDSIILLEDLTGNERSWLLAHPEFELTDSDRKILLAQIERRAQHEPLAYIRGKSEFYGREFLVTPHTLQPRPETETMITVLNNLLQHKTTFAEDGPLQRVKDVVIVDVGTGSGCIAITAKLEMTLAQVYATEINEAALKIARKNIKKLQADITLLHGNLLEPFTKLRDTSSTFTTVILANLPYVPNAHAINQAAMHEPRIAIFGGSDGLDLYRELFTQIDMQHLKVTYIFTESLQNQHRELTLIAKSHRFKLLVSEGLIQVFQSQ